MTHQTTWPEASVLDYFWEAVRQDVDRIALLRQIADVRLEHADDWDTAAIRYEHMGATHRLNTEACFACQSKEYRLYRHHIIQIQHGGSNAIRNQVILCHRCHGLVHPWLPAPTSLERRGFVAVTDMARNAGVMFDRAAEEWFRRKANEAQR